jgi:CBS domain-containing protein
MKVRDIMVETPKFCRPESNLIAAAETMSVSNCSLLPVVDQEGKVVGIITDRDICMTLAGKNQKPSDIRVRDAMSNRVPTCALDDDLKTALEKMEKSRVRRLPVVGRDGSLVGMVSLGDVTV